MQQSRNENPLIGMACNILLPVLILNKLSHYLGPGRALLLALAFPLAYGAWDFVRRRKTNVFSVLGLLNTLVTGGLAWVGVTGIWFAVKEAAFPLLIGIFVLVSAWTKNPAVEALFLNPSLFHVDRLKEKIAASQREAEFHGLLKKSTLWLAVSFFFSALLNFVLASWIFLPIPDGLDEAARGAQLNEQIASMTQWSMIVILVPSMVFLMGILYFVLRRVRALTGLTDEELLKIN